MHTDSLHPIPALPFRIEQQTYKERRILLQNNHYKWLAEAIIDNKFTVTKLIQDNRKSFVAAIECQGKTYLYKKNLFLNRKGSIKFTHRLLSEASSFKQFKMMNYFRENGVATPKAFLAIEKSRWGLREESIIIQSYEPRIRETANSDFQAAHQNLKSIHALGYIHGDPGKDNTLPTQHGVKIVDYRAKKNYFKSLGRAFELLKFSIRWKQAYPEDKGLAYYTAISYYRSHRALCRTWDLIRGAK